MKRVLVTGGSGFIGRQALGPLVDLGYDIHALDLRPIPLPGVTWHEADLFDMAAVAEVLDRVGARYCLHLAWDVSPGFWDAPVNTDWVSASLNLMRAFHAAGGRRFVSAGTCAEYDWTEASGSLAEDGPRNPSTFYGTTKDAQRRVIEGYARQTGLSWAWGVLFLCYGPHERPERLIPSVVLDLLRGSKARTTAGTQLRDFLDVRDQGAAFAALLDSEVEGVVNIGSGKAITIAEVVRRIGDITGRPQLLDIGALPMRPSEPERLVADVGRLRREVGFFPRISLDEGLADAVDWWRENR